VGTVSMYSISPALTLGSKGGPILLVLRYLKRGKQKEGGKRRG